MNIYDFKVKDNLGNEVSLDKYKGKVMVVVNTATKCGLTPQYAKLEEIYEKYKGNGLEILDFPCNQFLEQAPESDEGINSFCTLTYKTAFPRFSKIEVNGKNAAPLYVWLKKEAPHDITGTTTKAFLEKVAPYTKGNSDTDIKWNFCKFVIDKQGNVVSRFSPELDLAKLEEKIKTLL